MDSSTSMSSQSRDAVLERLSRSHLSDAMQAPSGDLGASQAAYQAGYFALMSSLSPEEVGSFLDHPNVEAAALGAQRLGLSQGDLDTAREDATGYYSPAARSLQEVRRQMEWARRARAAAGWAE